MRTRILVLALSTLGTAVPAQAQEVIGLLDGAQSGDLLGQTVAALGDLDGDGVGDFAVAAPRALRSPTDSSKAAGVVYVYSGDHQELLFDVAGVAFGDELGFSLAAAGDVDGDGIPDLLAGAPWHDGVGEDSGMGRVISGKTGQEIHQFLGDTKGGFFGYSTAGIGDINADGRSDLLVGAAGGPGYARVFSGADGGMITTYSGMVVYQVGTAVAGGGDVNLDGVPDFIVTAPFEAALGGSLGKARVYSGKTLAVLLDLAGNAPGSPNLGDSAAFLGDLNGDNRAEFAVGNRSGTPGLRVFNGANGAVLKTFQGGAADDIGFSVASVPDVNGDGRPDILVGAPNWQDGNNAAVGTSRLFSGSDYSLILQVDGDSEGDLAGHSVAPAGDVNQDGVPDLLLGAPLDDVKGTNAGRAVIYSPVTVPVPEVDLVLGDTVLGELSLEKKAHELYFDALKGSTLTLKVTTTGTSLLPRITLRNEQGSTLQQWSLAATVKDLKLTAPITLTGRYSLRVEGAAGTIGGYSLKTGRKLPAAAKQQKQTIKGVPVANVFCEALDGASLAISAKPNGDFPFSVAVKDPLGSTIDVSSLVTIKPSGAWKIAALPITASGTYTLVVTGLTKKKHTVNVKITPTQPKGFQTHSLN